MSSKLDYLLNQTKESFAQKENRPGRSSSQNKIQNLRQKFQSLSVKKDLTLRQRKNHLERRYLSLEERVEALGRDNSLNEASCQIEKLHSEVEALDKKQLYFGALTEAWAKRSCTRASRRSSTPSRAK